MPEIAVHPGSALPDDDVDAEAPAAGASGLAFAAFLAVNAILILRPMDLLPGLGGLPLYDGAILVALALALPMVIRQMSPDMLGARPITVCLIGLCVAAFCSHASRLDFTAAGQAGVELAKLLVYYLLLIAVIQSPGRLFTFVPFLGACLALMALLPVLQHHGYIHLRDLSPLEDVGYDPRTRQNYTFVRLCGPGVFHDPNDFAQVLAAGMPLCLYALGRARGRKLVRLAWGAALGLMGYAVVLTQSRGGFLAVLAAVGTLLIGWLGWRRSMMVGAIVLPALWFVFGGRQTDLSTASDTGHERIEIWADALAQFRAHPLFGIGKGEFGKGGGFVAHNSFLHAFTELGFFGGTMFLGAYGLSIVALARFRRTGANSDDEVDAEMDADPEAAQLRTIRPYLLASLAAYVTAMLSLTSCYMVITYAWPGLACAYEQVAAPADAVPWSIRLFGRLAAASALFILCVHVFVRASLY